MMVETEITGQDFIDNGWIPGPELGKALKSAQMLLKGQEYSKDEVMFRFPSPVVIEKLKPSDQSKDLQVALEPETDTNRENYDNVIAQMSELLKMPRIVRGSVMPDACPAGSEVANITVGGAIEVDGAIIPSAHSADMCCSMYATFFSSGKGISEMMDVLQDVTRFGPGGREDVVYHPIVDDERMKTNPFLIGLEFFAKSHIADQGDGNHFSFIGEMVVSPEFIDTLFNAGYCEDAESFKSSIGKKVFALVSHHGSRGLGARVYKRGLQEAERYTKKIASSIPKTAAWLDYDTEVGRDYWEAIQYIGDWTKANHQSIHRLFIEGIDTSKIYEFGNEHNFVWKRGDSFYHGKGATPAWNDSMGRPLMGLIPLNMGREILIVLGSDNDRYLSFAPHGAGRNISRTAVMMGYKGADGELDEEKIAEEIGRQTEGIEARWYSGEADLTETPMAYKDPDKVKSEIEKFDLAKVIGEISPLGSLMAGKIKRLWNGGGDR